jgi:hypothetical protein
MIERTLSISTEQWSIIAEASLGIRPDWRTAFCAGCTDELLHFGYHGLREINDGVVALAVQRKLPWFQS